MKRFSTSLAAALTLALAAGALTAAAGDPVEEKAPKEYTVEIKGKEISITMVPIPGGTLKVGSPATEEGRKEDEGPQYEVEIEPFWMGKFEITWDVFNEFRIEYTAHSNERLDPDKTPQGDWVDAVSLPTPLWAQDSVPILEGLGTEGGFPAAGSTQYAAKQFTKWLSKRTGQFYRLPTEAEWEHAARAGTSTAYYFGDAAEALSDHAWTFDNSEYQDLDKGYPGEGAGYRKVGLKQPNPWGLHDIYGNVSEWVIDKYDAESYLRFGGEKTTWREAILWPTRIYPCVARGGNWRSDPEECRSAARLASHRDWQDRDPQIPKSVWWLTDGFNIGFRIVRPMNEISEEERQQYWDGGVEAIDDVLKEGAKQVRAKIGGSESSSSK